MELQDACAAWQGGMAGGSSPIRAAARCSGCEWSLQYTDPRFLEHAEELGWMNIGPEGPIIAALDALSSNFVPSVTLSRRALPDNHPANSTTVDTMTAAEFRINREQLGLSAEWLAERLGVALKTVQRWENGYRTIPDGVAEEMRLIATAMEAVAARPIAEHLLAAPDNVMLIPRTGTHLGFPAGWYRALVVVVRDILTRQFGDEGIAAATFKVVYLDEVEGQL